MTKAKTAKTAKTAAKAPAKTVKKKPAKTGASKQVSTRSAAGADWSSTIKKAAQEKKSHPAWPGTGDNWKKKSRV
jgi:hypothetical protein